MAKNYEQKFFENYVDEEGKREIISEHGFTVLFFVFIFKIFFQSEIRLLRMAKRMRNRIEVN